MQAWTGDRSRCFFCSLREIARWTLKSPNNRAFGSTPKLSRSRVRERIAKGRWKDSILTPARASKRNAEDQEEQGRFSILRGSGTESISKAISKSLRLQQSGKPAAELELQHLRQTLRTGKTPDGTESTYSELDPELKYFDYFEARVKQCFEDEDEKKERTDVTDPLRVSLVQAYVENGRTALRKALLFAYVDHIIASQRKTDKTSTLPRHLDLRYPTEWYSSARATQRNIHLHVGPTNSGKTYHALKRLEESGKGMYAGPLRLLAHEVYTRFNNKGLPCDLITGDDVRMRDGEWSSLSSHTVEMVDIGRSVDVAVIDEIQMIASEERGWAWTRALLGIPAKELHLCGETRVIPLIRELAASMGDTLHIHHYDRLNPLKAMSKSLRGNLKNLVRGDCIVSFSVLGIHAMKKQIELETGRRVAIVYGSLPPEIRAQQAALFNEPNNDYDFLVASDAIGMGLNLSIKRIIFESIWKHNGTRRVQLSTSQIKQIAGRAGRYRVANQGEKEKSEDTKLMDSQDPNARVTSFKGTVKQSNVGLVTCIDEKDLHEIQTALNTEPEPIKAAGLQAPVEFIDAFAQTLPPGTPYEYLLRLLTTKSVIHPRFFMCNHKDLTTVAACLDNVKGLSVFQRHVFTAAPSDAKADVGVNVLKALAKCVAKRKAVTIVDVPELPLDILELPPSGDRQYLLELELLHKSLILYLWLSYRFSNIFLDREMAIHAKEMCEEKINTTLLEFSANPKLRRRLLEMRHIEYKKDASNKSHENSDGTISEEPVAEEDLTESLNDLSALPIDWEHGNSGDHLNADAGALEIRQREAARP